MPTYLWILELFLFLLLLHCINAIINPERIVQWTIERYQRFFKFYGFESQIKASPRSSKVIRVGHIIVGLIILIYMTLILLYGRNY